MAKQTSRRSKHNGRGAAAVSSAADHTGHDHVYGVLSKALLAGRLKPGSPLRERHLAEIFNVTRAATRKALLQLAEEGKLEVFANRGAYVPQPSADAVRRVYEARKAVEAGLVAVLAGRVTPSQLSKLKAHVAKERHAEQRGERDESVRLAGAFHSELVALAENPTLEEIVLRLISRTQIYVALFESARHSGCAPEEHRAIVDALGKKDASRAAAAMIHHLQLVEARVSEYMTAHEAENPEDVLRELLS
ncbi:MAG: GntR family transcriptional regulator [Xanthobacteraceae bacterium]|nr:GntR family transcriptional regulator [Xanthobacteraceae bacterium]